MGPFENPITETALTVIQKNRDYIESLGSREEKNGNMGFFFKKKQRIAFCYPLLAIFSSQILDFDWLSHIEFI